MSSLHVPFHPHRTATPGRRAHVVLLGLEAFVALNAVVAGALLLAGVTRFDAATEADLPLRSSRLGGLALGLVVGLVPAAALILDRRRSPWAPFAHVVVGPTVVVWILVQVAFIGWSSVLQPAVLLYGLVLAAIAAVDVGRPAR